MHFFPSNIEKYAKNTTKILKSFFTRTRCWFPEVVFKILWHESSEAHDSEKEEDCWQGVEDIHLQIIDDNEDLVMMIIITIMKECDINDETNWGTLFLASLFPHSNVSLTKLCSLFGKSACTQCTDICFLHVFKNRIILIQETLLVYCFHLFSVHFLLVS